MISFIQCITEIMTRRRITKTCLDFREKNCFLIWSMIEELLNCKVSVEHDIPIINNRYEYIVKSGKNYSMWDGSQTGRILKLDFGL